LSERQRDVLSLHVRGCKRPQIAARLGFSPRVVQRELEAIMRVSRREVARLAGGGCETGEALVLRRSCGLATPGEAVKARSHVAGCDRCQGFADRLDVWREVASVLPVPAGAQVHLGRVGEGLAALRQYIADVGTSAKQQAASLYYRVSDPAPLGTIRPGAAAAVIAGCVAVGTAGTVCVQSVNPWSAATGLVVSEPEQKPKPPPVQSPPAPAAPDPATQAPTAAAPQPTSAPQPERKPEPPPPPPEAAFEPSSASAATRASSAGSTPSPAPPASSAADRQFQP
jgi:hypothetical protein